MTKKEREQQEADRNAWLIIFCMTGKQRKEAVRRRCEETFKIRQALDIAQ